MVWRVGAPASVENTGEMELEYQAERPYATRLCGKVE